MQVTTTADWRSYEPTDLLTYDEWWAEYRANQCCPDPQTAAARLCGCGGNPIPATASRLLLADRGDE